MTIDLKKLAIKKADQGVLKYKVSAIAISKKGNILGSSINAYRWSTAKEEGFHAERLLIRKFGKRIRTIIICRTNGKGTVLPIDPCSSCKKTATKLGIKIISVCN